VWPGCRDRAGAGACSAGWAAFLAGSRRGARLRRSGAGHRAGSRAAQAVLVVAAGREESKGRREKGREEDWRLVAGKPGSGGHRGAAASSRAGRAAGPCWAG
jgi:hypothetical protein